MAEFVTSTLKMGLWPEACDLAELIDVGQTLELSMGFCHRPDLPRVGHPVSGKVDDASSCATGQENR